MIRTFDPGADPPRISRKHRRLDDTPPDAGDESRPAPTASLPLCRDSLMKDNVENNFAANEVFEDDDIEIHEEDEICLDVCMGNQATNSDLERSTMQPAESNAVSSHNQDSISDGSFGPWMIDARHPRRNIRVPYDPTKMAPTPIQTSRFNPILDAESDDVTTTSKASKAPGFRKPLTINLSEFHALSRFASKTFSSRSSSNENQGISLDKTRHMATVMQENANPNVIHVPLVNNTSTDLALAPTLGDPPDML
ncbi:hypothetical protein V6N13_080170 [Hibiscus sabdariffa]